MKKNFSGSRLSLKSYFYDVMKYREGLVFCLITIVFVLSRIIIFKGFNGSDDLHYAMLAVKLLRGTYNPFEQNDIFSGRILLIVLQAVVYKLGGISVFTTAVGTIMAIILSCQLTIFRLLPVKNVLSIILGTSLFYFNPALTQATIGILPDAYIMLAGTIILVILKKDFSQPGSRCSFNAFMIGFIMAITLLIKETAVVFISTVVILALIYKRGKPVLYVVQILGSFAFFSLLIVVIYSFFAGDPFIRLVQIRNSSYPGPCSFAMLPARDLVIRLTYGVWQSFIVHGFYPVVLGLGVILTVVLTGGKRGNFDKRAGSDEIISMRKNHPLFNFQTTSFLLILFTSIFFPFSLNGYEPLCADPRHFIFLIPFAVVLVVNFTCTLQTKSSHAYMALFVLIAVCVCVGSTQNKWQWMIYSLFFASCILRFVPWSRSQLAIIGMLSVILWVSILEGLFFRKTTWFNDMQVLKMRIASQQLPRPVISYRDETSQRRANISMQPIAYYFADHDNMMHWKLFNQFDESETGYFNLDPKPFKIHKIYYQFPDTASFIPGWLIINKTYPGTSVRLVENLNSPQWLKLMPTVVKEGNVNAYFIEEPKQLIYVSSMIVRQN